jgi:thiosulfate/3-mercaptopyruvate sulfurtransferase
MKPELFLCVVVLAGSVALASEAKYARPNLLIEPAALAQASGQFVVLDARESKPFAESRIPGAVWVDAAAWAKAFDDGKNALDWAARIGKLGLHPQSKVVVYDASSFKDAARVWWLLRYWGVADVRLLNGGWSGWKAAGQPIETGKPRDVAAAEFHPAPRPERLATKGQLLDGLKAKSRQIVDARSEAEHCGIDLAKNKRGGSIPGAKHLDWVDLVDKKTQRFKGPDEIQALFRQAGIDLAQPTTTYCQSGGRASVMLFVLELMGASGVRNYYASWAEWGNDPNMPIEVPKPKKDK